MMYDDIDKANDDVNYGLTPSLTSSPSAERFNGPIASTNNAFGSDFPFYPLSFDTIAPSSLELSHTSHDDSCLDKCLGTYGTQRIQQNVYAQPYVSRARLFNNQHIYPHSLQENNAFQQHQVNQHFNMFQDYTNVGFKYNLDHDLKQGYHTSNSESLIGLNNFNVSDIGIMPNNQVPDDCTSVNCSKYSCSSDCCSTQVCQDEECSGDGTPCDDLQCLESVSQDIWAMNEGWHESIQPGLAPNGHNQPCNHDESEHDAARTLRDLGAPGASNIQQNQQDFSQFDCLFDTTNQSADLTRSSGLTLPLHPHPSLASTPELDSTATPREGSIASTAQHLCRWVVSGQKEPQRICGHVCDSAHSLQDHMSEEHLPSMNNKTKYRCLWENCPRLTEKVFASRNKLRRHLTTHTAYKPFKCDTCGESFSAQQALDQHIRTHTGETPYKCDFEGCEKAFKQKSALTMHKRTHTGERPLECDICGKRFCESSNLSKHRKTHSPEFKFGCEEPGCGKRFNRVDQLRRHEAIHERPKKKRKVRAEAEQVFSSPISPETPHDPALHIHDQQLLAEIQV
ncbi:uncharacterized protein F4822DRAFT_68273 [Hypoxylon trugodes]|uniref:uncharacterized protein n=1 Tax=Hypoxylon trugodes TaxID=326681 RepID=UPI00219A7531|nr:uncharacterized protein F4822DRAFT_68273 [Hypoxylon trugodes]KAI1383196.1 hypothetical protein F4822DRAFT_68273 [Hypoxylon trugodes]